MQVSGLVKSSLVDYPGKISAVIFTQGCNLRCGFCHNPDLIAMSDQQSKISKDELLEFLKSRKGKLDGVVITGGEPTLQPDLYDFTKKVKTLGYYVKLDTNGSSPSVLGSLITDRLIDYVAMDIKNSPKKYQLTCGLPFTAQMQKSIKDIMESSVDYEFRTTVLPLYHKPEDFHEIGKIIKGAKKYTVQGFRDKIFLDKTLKKTKKFTREELEKIKSVLVKYVKNVTIRDNI